MKRIAMTIAIWFALSPPLQPQSAKQEQREACMYACMLERPDADIQRQEVIALEKETAHAIQLKDATFFRRVYSDGFSGVLSRGETVDRASFITAVQSPDVMYESFTVSDLKIKLYRDIAVVSGTWSVRAVLKGQRASSQMRILHVYSYGGDGYHLISAQATLLPPYVEQPL
jgi:ketosteroid isomerase-like protein